jgi:uncharacterized protein
LRYDTRLLAHFSGYDPVLRDRAVLRAENLLADPTIEVRPQSCQFFLDGFALSRGWTDEGFRLTDCVSMGSMRGEGLTEVLTHDAHFTQEGFILL